jgi:hypothetical protein
MRSLFLLFLFLLIAVAIALFFKGHANSVNLYHICGKEVPWHDAVFLEPIRDKDGCDKYQ